MVKRIKNDSNEAECILKQLDDVDQHNILVVAKVSASKDTLQVIEEALDSLEEKMLNQLIEMNLTEVNSFLANLTFLKRFTLQVKLEFAKRNLTVKEQQILYLLNGY
jgi:hypothetical protein